MTGSDSNIANVVVIGGGVIGLAVTAEVSRYYDDVFLLEAMPRLGLGSSTRNSGVIHAGIYYPPGSLKATHCVRGSRLLYEFCEENRVPYRRTGKLIVVDDEKQLPELEDLKRRGDENGAIGLEIVDAKFIRRIEPNLKPALALYSPNTGIVDTDEYVKALARLAASRGASILTGTRLFGAEIRSGLAILETQRERVEARVVINAAGLYADEVARMFGEERFMIYPCRGEYAELPPSKSHIVNGLVYPLPMKTGHGLGVHFTKNMAGTLLLGPNARYVERKDDYENDRTDMSAFYEDAIRFVPGLKLEDLRPGYTGIRSRLLPEQDHSFADFNIISQDGPPSIVHAIGMESPGLTSSLSLGRYIGELIRRALA